MNDKFGDESMWCSVKRKLLDALIKNDRYVKRAFGRYQISPMPFQSSKKTDTKYLSSL
jgi:hypothetical protein